MYNVWAFLLSGIGVHFHWSIMLAIYIYIGLNRCYKNLTHLINFLDEAKVKLQQARSSTASYYEEHTCMKCMTINGLDSCSPVHY